MQFTYEQKDQLFGERPPQPQEREGIGRLLNKYGRKAVDDEQEQQIQRKKLVYPANSLNYSQIYSDLHIDYKEKLRPVEPSQPIQDSRTFPRAPESFNYVPKSLPKIKRNSRISHNRESSKYVLNNTYEESAGEAGFTRTKAFSISHYDIFKNENNRLDMSESKQKENHTVPLHDFLGKNSQFLSQSYHKNEEQNIKVDFQSIAEHDLPEQNDQQIQQNVSNIVQKQPQIQPQHTLEELSKEQIKLQNHKFESKPQKNSINSAEVGAIKEGQKKETEDDQVKEELNSHKNSKLSKSSSIRSKQKEIKLDQIKRQYSKKMEQESKKAAFVEPKKKQSIEHRDDIIQGKTSGQIKLFERKIEKSVQLPELKNSFTSVQLVQSKDSNMKDEITKFKEQIVKVRKEIHGVKEQMNEVKEEVHDFKGGVSKENSRAIQKNQQYQEKNEHSEQNHQISKGFSINEQETSPNVQQNRASKKQQVVLEVDQQYEQHKKFVVSNYIQVYEILKDIQKDLKVPQINFHGLIKGVKKYLQVVAMGGLDHIQEYDMPLNRLKIIKNALLYERISIVIIAFSFAVGKVKESLKYLINLVGYATNNTLLILKILEGGESNQSKNPILAKSDRLVLKRNFDTIRNNNDIVLDSIFKISKQEQAFYQPFKQILKSIGKNSIQQTFYNVLQYFSFFLCVSDLSKNLPFLAVAPNPYLRESIEKRPTLIIDIIEVFCHGTKKSKSHVFRPHTEHFLNEMSQYFELISFTCAYPNQIDKVIDILDQKRHIKHRLYRHHALMKNNILIKDPERIGRDLSRLIIIDSEVALMSQDTNNTIVVPSWKGNRNDTTLAQLCPILAAIALKNLDCRQATKKIHEQQLKNQHAGIKYLNFGINLQ